MSLKFVIKWTKSPKQNFAKDMRGWPKGKTRKYTKTDEQKIRQIHRELIDDSKAFFAGASAILQKWQEQYPKIKPPQPRFICRTLKKYNLSEKIKKGRNKGASRYLHYPEYSINQIGASLLEIDFIGKKFIRNRTQPLNFIGFSLKKPRKLKHFRQVTEETGDNVIQELKRFFKRFEKTDVVKMDNGFAMAGAPIIPVFAPPRKPWFQASIEGSNSVFARKFWNRFEFRNVKQVDEKLEDFNKSYQWYLDYQSPTNKSAEKKRFIPKIYFIRKIYENSENSKGCIELVNEKVFLTKTYINFFVLAEWNLKKEILNVYFEKEQKPKLIKKLLFKINQKSKENYFKSDNLLFVI